MLERAKFDRVVYQLAAARVGSPPRDEQLAFWLNAYNALVLLSVVFFFFQAEDGIRDIGVTGVQTCALPISTPQCAPCLARKEPSWRTLAPAFRPCSFSRATAIPPWFSHAVTPPGERSESSRRSEERRVGKEWRCRWAADAEKKRRVIGELS